MGRYTTLMVDFLLFHLQKFHSGSVHKLKHLRWAGQKEAKAGGRVKNTVVNDKPKLNKQ